MNSEAGSKVVQRQPLNHRKFVDFTLRDEKKLQGFEQKYCGIVALWKMDVRTKRTVEILGRETNTKL